MSKKIIPFVKGGTSSDTVVDEEGSIGHLKYKVYKRGVIHVIDENKGLIFKKDPDLFEDAVNQLKLNSLKDGETAVIKGSGDNDDLVFECTNGDIDMRLEKKSYGMVSKLKKIFESAKKKKNN